MKLVFLFSALIISLGCSTNQKSRIATTGIGIGVGALVGSATSPSDERPELHAMYWGGIVGVVTAIAANYYFNDEKEISTLQAEKQSLQNQLEIYQNSKVYLRENVGNADPKYFPGGKALFKIYKVDEWKEESPYKRYHIDQEVILSPLKK